MKNAPREIQEKAYRESPFRQASHFIEYQFDGEIENWSDKEDSLRIANKVFGDLITTLRLLKPAVVDRSYSYHKSRMESSDLLSVLQLVPEASNLNENSKENLTRYDTVQVIYSIEPYELLEEDVPRLKEVFNAVKECTEGVVRVFCISPEKVYFGDQTTRKCAATG